MKHTLSLLLLILLSLSHRASAAEWRGVVGKTAAESRAEWQRVTSGEELARGKEVRFLPKPNYPLTTDDNDAHDLTSGVLSARKDDRVWFSKDAVGWHYGVGTGTGILMIVDLGQAQPVGQVALRTLGGREQGALELPASVELLASLDGTHYYRLQRMAKLTPAESELSDFKTAFYIPEEGTAFMVPLVCAQPVRARFIALRVTPQSSLFVDQLSILKATDGTALQDLASFPPVQVFTDGLAAVPRSGEFVVTTNIVTPNWIEIQDFTGTAPGKSLAGFRLELPEGLELLPQSKPAFTETKLPRAGWRSYEFARAASHGSAADATPQGPLYITVHPGAKIPQNASIVLTGLLDGQPSHTLEYPLQLVEIPTVPPLPALDISLAWMSDDEEKVWPDFLPSFSRMGFNLVSTFPRNIPIQRDGTWPSAEFLGQARQQGYRVVYNESPFHVMDGVIRSRLKAGKIEPAEAAEIFNQVKGQPGKYLSPLYRGRFFREELERVAKLTARAQPDHVYLDVELWARAVVEAKQDPRVQDAWKSSGLSWDDFITNLGSEALGSLVKAIRDAVPKRQLTVGLYNSDPDRSVMDGMFQWTKIYPGILDVAMPSIYVQGRALDVARRLRADHEALQNRQIIPWLTAGTYGKFPAHLMEPMVLETILNGARGLTYYEFSDFDPMDFYFHARALAALGKFPQLLQTGKPIPCQGSNPALHYTCFASDSEALLLVGNYSKAPHDEVTVPLPMKSISQAAMVDGQSLPIEKGSISMHVPAGEFRLIHLTAHTAGEK
ncbi:hypothetical protein [Chthoniobacter flavus]|nr:hypothetical protein [Chthoniobacter flavus]